MKIVYQAWGNVWKGELEPHGFALYATGEYRDATVDHIHEVHHTQRAIGEPVEIDIPDEYFGVLFKHSEGWREIYEVDPEDIPDYIRNIVWGVLWGDVCMLEERRLENERRA